MSEVITRQDLKQILEACGVDHLSVDSNGYLKIDTSIILPRQEALYTTDSANFIYPLIVDNGANLWIGSRMTAAQHHTGATFISSGYNGTNGNESIFVSVPNANNDGATNRKVWHEGNLPTPIPINKGGTGQTTAADAFKALSGRTLDLDTNNTSDTWVPVLKGASIQHRVIPRNIPYDLSAVGGTKASSIAANGRQEVTIDLSSQLSGYNKWCINYANSDHFNVICANAWLGSDKVLHLIYRSFVTSTANFTAQYNILRWKVAV